LLHKDDTVKGGQPIYIPTASIDSRLEQIWLTLEGNDDPFDGNYNGYKFWLNKLNQCNGDFLQATMVNVLFG